MRRPTFHVLSTAFTLAALGCKKEPLPEPPPPVPSAPTPTATSSVTTTTLAPGEKRYGQRCGGEVVANLKPAKAVDYLELRLDYYHEQKHEIVVAGSRGEPCAQAKDKKTCESTLATAKAAKGGSYLVYVRGDEIGTVNGKATAAFLAPIDTPEEAALTLVDALAENASTAAILPSCSAADYKPTNDGWETTHTIHKMCDAQEITRYVVTKNGEVKQLETKETPPKPGCNQYPQRGRRPEGFTLAAHPNGATLGGHFAESAELEAASVDAFRRLEEELRVAGAPESLRRRARRSAHDEIRHTHVMTTLAARFGGSPRPFIVASRAPRSLVEMAIENAVEGCVFETWAALVATFQAEHAGDAEVRAAMKTIARDETRHAALAWDVAAFLDARVSAADRARVRSAREDAFARLASMIAEEPSAEMRVLVGQPTAGQARALFEQLLEVVDDVAAAAA
jgi:hypothetical protein